MLVEVLAKDGVAGKDRIGLRPGRGASTEERAWRAEFRFEKFKPAAFIPFGEIGRGRATGGKEFVDREIMESAVLTNIQNGEMKAESIECAANGRNGGIHQSPSPHRRQRSSQAREKTVGVTI